MKFMRKDRPFSKYAVIKDAYLYLVGGVCTWCTTFEFIVRRYFMMRKILLGNIIYQYA